MSTSFVLVHGAWHGAGHWSAVAPELARRGHRVIALDLPGHGTRARFPEAYFEPGQQGLADAGSPNAEVTLDAAAQVVLDAARAAASRGPVVLVGHSMGGPVVTRAGELAPELFANVVYVAAFAPTLLPSAGACLAQPEAASALGAGLYVGDPAATGAVRINPRSTDRAYLEELRAAYYSDVDADVFAAFLAAMTPDLPAAFVVEESGATPDRWGTVARTYVRCTADRALPVALQDRMIAEADAFTPGNAFTTLDLESGHCAFASQPSALAGLLAGVAG